jgi:hypothetical protein
LLRVWHGLPPLPFLGQRLSHIADDPSLEKTIIDMPSVVYSTRPHKPREKEPEGVLVYMRTAEDNDALS